jgi:hypothetical protein
MLEAPILEGWIRHPAGPDWAPLERFLPLELCAPFMFMHEVDVDESIRVRAYKHSDTRRYLLLDDLARPYESLDHGRYRRMRHYDAIEQVFSVCWLLGHATDEEKRLLRELLDQASSADHADFAAGLQIMPSSPACGFRTLP